MRTGGVRTARSVTLPVRVALVLQNIREYADWKCRVTSHKSISPINQ